MLPAVIGFCASFFIFVLATQFFLSGSALWYSWGLPIIGSPRFDLVVFLSFSTACLCAAAIFVSLRWSVKSAIAASILWFAAPALMVFEFVLQRATALFGEEIMEEHVTNVTAAAFPWLTNYVVLYVAALLFDVGVGWACFRALPANLSGKWRIFASLALFAAAFVMTATVYSINFQYAAYMWGRGVTFVHTQGQRPIQAT